MCVFVYVSETGVQSERERGIHLFFFSSESEGNPRIMLVSSSSKMIETDREKRE